MENTFCSSLEANCSKETADAIETALKNYNIKPETVSGIFKSLTDENDWGIIKVNGERITLKVEDLSDPQKLIADMAVFVYKSTQTLVGQIRNEIEGLYVEAHIDRYGELLGQQEVLLKCLKRKHSNVETIEMQLNSLMVKTKPVLLEIQNKINTISKKSSSIPKINKDKSNDINMLIESSVAYFESINVIIQTLLYLGEIDEAKQYVGECKDFISKTITTEFNTKINDLSKNMGKNMVNRINNWSACVTEEREYLAILEDRFKYGRFEISYKQIEKR